MKLQVVAILVAFLVFYLINPKAFNLNEGIKYTVIVLIVIMITKLTLSRIATADKISRYNVKDIQYESLILVLRLFKSMMFVFAIASTVFTLIALIGVWGSNETVNTAHLFFLSIPFWLVIRGEVVRILISIRNYHVVD